MAYLQTSCFEGWEDMADAAIRLGEKRFPVHSAIMIREFKEWEVLANDNNEVNLDVLDCPLITEDVVNRILRRVYNTSRDIFDGIEINTELTEVRRAHRNDNVSLPSDALPYCPRYRQYYQEFTESDDDDGEMLECDRVPLATAIGIYRVLKHLGSRYVIGGEPHEYDPQSKSGVEFIIRAHVRQICHEFPRYTMSDSGWIHGGRIPDSYLYTTCEQVITEFNTLGALTGIYDDNIPEHLLHYPFSVYDKKQKYNVWASCPWIRLANSGHGLLMEVAERHDIPCNVRHFAKKCANVLANTADGKHLYTKNVVYGEFVVERCEDGVRTKWWRRCDATREIYVYGLGLALCTMALQMINDPLNDTDIAGFAEFCKSDTEMWARMVEMLQC